MLNRNTKNRSDLLYIGLGRIAKLYGFYIVIMTLFRFFFVFYFDDQSVLANNTLDVVKAYYYGWLYDTMVLSYILLPVFIFLILSTIFRSVFLLNTLQVLMKVIFILCGIFIPFILISDYGFYSYFQDHLNILFFGLLEDDTSALIETIQKNYPIEVALVAFGIYIIGLWFLARRIFVKLLKNKSRYPSSIIKPALSIIGVFILFIGGIRGGYGKFVLAPKYADFSNNEFINQIPINGCLLYTSPSPRD